MIVEPADECSELDSDRPVVLYIYMIYNDIEYFGKERNKGRMLSRKIGVLSLKKKCIDLNVKNNLIGRN